MQNRIARNKNIKILDGKTRRETPRGALTGIIFCKVCKAVYYKKSWHHNLEEGLKKIKETAPVHFTTCVACDMVARGEFEGEIIIENVPPKIKTDLTHLAESFGKRAYEKDPMDRVIAITREGSGMRITTTENQLAVKLAKKINEAFKGKAKILYSAKPSAVARIKISFENTK